MNCRFCAIIKDRAGEWILCETKHTVTILSNPWLMPGHMLVMPKRHVERLSELNSRERNDLLDQVIFVQEKILRELASGCDICQHFRPFIPENPLKVNHLHIHLRPRELNDELYEKVQSHEREVFQEMDKGEIERYKKLFAHS